MIMTDLSIIVRGGNTYATRSLAEFDINFAEMHILMYLFGHEKCNQDSIARDFMLDKGTIARTLAKLENKGFLSRRANDENLREKVIELSEKAYGILEVSNNLLSSWIEIMFKGLSNEEIAVFEKTVEKIALNVSETL